MRLSSVPDPHHRDFGGGGPHRSFSGDKIHKEGGEKMARVVIIEVEEASRPRVRIFRDGLEVEAPPSPRTSQEQRDREEEIARAKLLDPNYTGPH